MGSLLIWRKSTGEIMACMPMPRGDAPAPTIETTFPHRPDLWPDLACEWIKPNLTTLQAQEALEIRDGKPAYKEAPS